MAEYHPFRLNSLMPPEYRSGVRVHLGTAIEVDVAAFENEGFTGSSNGMDGGTAIAWAPAPATLLLDTADPTLPEYEAGFSNTFGLFRGRINVNTLIDYRGKYWNSYGIGVNRCVTAGNCPEVNVPGSSLEAQAAAVAASSGTLNNTRWGIFKPNDFIKLREISVSANLPESYVGRYLRGRTAQIVFAGRNLSTLWTKYPGIDPEANRQVSNLANGNDDLGTPPAIRTFNVRLNLGF